MYNLKSRSIHCDMAWLIQKYASKSGVDPDRFGQLTIVLGSSSSSSTISKSPFPTAHKRGVLKFFLSFTVFTSDEERSGLTADPKYWIEYFKSVTNLDIFSKPS